MDQAQKDKHDYILKGINFKPGDRILDIGCGWGPMLNAIRKNGGKEVGITLSSAQNRYNVIKGLNSRLQDYKIADPKKTGKFYGVVAVGAMEAFCSIVEYKAGKQEEIYRQFFKFCSDVLPKKGRLFLQTILWGKKVPNPDDLRLDARKGSDEYILALGAKFFPGSWLPANKEQIIKCAKPYFKFISSNNGRLDYLQTLKEWSESWSSIWDSPRKAFKAIKGIIKLIPKYLTSRDFRAQLEFGHCHGQTELFKREVFTHERMFFEKR